MPQEGNFPAASCFYMNSRLFISIKYNIISIIQQ